MPSRPIEMLPDEVRAVLRVLHKSWPRPAADAETYWRSRAKLPGEQAVMFTNSVYTGLVRERQLEVLRPYVMALAPGNSVLDIGCGVGTISAALQAMRSDVDIVGVDFPEMIAVAKEKVSGPRLQFQPGSAEGYLAAAHSFDLILSVGCYSCIRDRGKLSAALSNAVTMLKPSGTIVMIDPFHTLRALQRAPYGADEIVDMMAERGLEVVQRGGIMFWPMREVLSNSNQDPDKIRRKFASGERMLERLGAYKWSDYKVMAFRWPRS